MKIHNPACWCGCGGPWGLCHCGCGETTKIATKTDRSHPGGGRVKGRPMRYLLGHTDAAPRKPVPPRPKGGRCYCGCGGPWGLCHCGCGEKTNIAARRYTKGVITYERGQPYPYLGGHQRIHAHGSTCSVRGCDRPPTIKGLCISHYRRRYATGDLRADVPIGYRLQDGPCEVEGCERPARSKGICAAHYERLRKTGDVQADVPLRKIGEWGTNSTGYRERMINGVRISEHREIMEEIIGRPLHPWENIHHRNGIRHDNRPENLELWAVSQPSGQRVADLAHWVAEVYPAEIAAAGLVRGPRETPPTVLVDYDPELVFTDAAGYRRIRLGRNRSEHPLEHRVILACVLGRELEGWETVHHRNGIRTDNRPENLELWATPQPKGQRVADLVDWVINAYPDEIAEKITEREVA